MTEPALLPTPVELITYGLYRLSAYALLNWTDDVAILAFMFC